MFFKLPCALQWQSDWDSPAQDQIQSCALNQLRDPKKISSCLCASFFSYRGNNIQGITIAQTICCLVIRIWETCIFKICMWICIYICYYPKPFATFLSSAKCSALTDSCCSLPLHTFARASHVCGTAPRWLLAPDTRAPPRPSAAALSQTPRRDEGRKAAWCTARRQPLYGAVGVGRSLLLRPMPPPVRHPGKVPPSTSISWVFLMNKLIPVK